MVKQLTPEAALDLHIPKRWLTIVRAIWLALVLLLIAIFVAGISPLFDDLRMVCVEGDCHVLALSPQEANALRSYGLSLEFYAGYFVGLDIFTMAFLLPLAGLIFWRRSDTWMGILVSLTLVLLGALASPAPIALVKRYPDLQPLFAFLNSFFVFFVLLFYLFPDGRFVPRWTRIIVIVLVGTFLIGLVFPAFSPLHRIGTSNLETGILLMGSVIVGVFAQIYRYRHVSTSSQRQQTKWTVFGLIAESIVILLWQLFAELFPLQPGPARLAFNFSLGIQVLFFTLFPVSLAVSILRYRLWDIDVIIRRTLLYGTLTGLLGLGYFGSVVLLQTVFRRLTGEKSSLAIIVSTLVIAALFAPLRRRVQAFIDRRFYRRRYDAQVTLELFSERARDEVDLDTLEETLLAVVERTFKPTRASLWVREKENQHLDPAGQPQASP